MKLFLYPNTLSAERREAAARCARILAARFDCFAAPDCAAWLHPGVCRIGAAEDCDLVVAFGGDGTVLRAAKLAVAVDRPLLGVNTGRLGYLCACTEADLSGFDIAALAGLRRVPRALLEFEWQGRTVRALNELMLTKADFGTTLDASAVLGDRRLGSWQGDGLLVSTPTGSTAYNLSAGGPLLLPDCASFVLTPLCPVGQRANSIVYPDGETLVLKARARVPQQQARVYADGVFVGALEAPLTVRRAARPLVLLERAE